MHLYESFSDDLPEGKYVDNLVALFALLDRWLKPDAPILMNLGYGAGTGNEGLPFRTVAALEARTRWRVRDVLCWMKDRCVPLVTSPSRLSRIWEPIFVFARGREYFVNKRVVNVNPRTQQRFYETPMNLIRAPCRDPQPGCPNHVRVSHYFASVALFF